MNLPDTSASDAGKAFPSYAWANLLANVIAPTIGAPVAVLVAWMWAVPTHAVVGMFVMAYATGFGVTIGFHRLFAHRSFATSRWLERILMVLGCMAGQSAPFFWIATHRLHHRHSDTDDDPHSPHTSGGRKLGGLRGFWHAHFGWIRTRGFDYSPAVVRDLMRRRDLAWIDSHWLLWYLLGLAIPAGVGFAIGGTAYDALMGFLWGGLLRHFLTLQATFLVNSLNHLWGSRPYPTADHSRNNMVTGILAFGEGWHNNHHAFPWSARQGLKWWQPDLSWWVIWTMEACGLVWRVRRVKQTNMRGEKRGDVSLAVGESRT
jgi:stearoyl-CoA desaturase (delta-9 desaturase)